MSAATKAPRTSAAVSADIEARTARQVALTAQLATVRESRTGIRADRARAVADGKPGPSAGAIAALVEEETGLESALELIASDLARLETERATVALHEAERDERDAIANAKATIEKLDVTMRATAMDEILPLADGLLVALDEAHDCEKETNRLRRLHNPSGPSVVGSRSDRVTHRRGELLQVVDALRRFVATSQKPSVVKAPVERLEDDDEDEDVVPVNVTGPAAARAS